MTQHRWLLAVTMGVAATAVAQTVIVRPKNIDDALINPGIGIQTFQRFAGQAIYPSLHWSEVGPEGKVADAPGSVDFPRSSVAYLRWFWSQLEPQRGKYRWEIIDSALEQWLTDDTRSFETITDDLLDALPRLVTSASDKK